MLSDMFCPIVMRYHALQCCDRLLAVSFICNESLTLNIFNRLKHFFTFHASADATQDGALDRFKTKIVLSSSGRNMWLGPVLYTFSCKIDVKFFPFDEQVSP